MNVESLLGISTVLFGIMSGTYFAFSIVVMPALKQLPAKLASEVMKQINSDILRSLFMLFFWLSTFMAFVLICLHINWSVTISGACYVVGMFGTTAICNVPLNKKLAQATTDELDHLWATYLKYWTRWNHIRTICSVFALVLSTHELANFDL